MITDPPAGIGLFGFDWDQDRGGRNAWVAWMTQVMTECHRVLKPGAHGFVWAIPRTSHWTGTALENSGFIIKDIVTHIFGSGFPKNTNIEKSMRRVKYSDTDFLFKVTAWIRIRRDELGLINKDLDQIAGVKGGACHWTAVPPNGQPNIPTLERWEKLSTVLGPAPEWMIDHILPSYKEKGQMETLEKSSSSDSNSWRGWGTALKPASEHWILIQKPLSEHNLTANIKKHGTGAIHIDATRIPVIGKIPSTSNLNFRDGSLLWDNSKRSESSVYNQHPNGRFPANLIITGSDDQTCPKKILKNQDERRQDVAQYFKCFEPDLLPFVYCKKPAKKEKGSNNIHPTVKPIKLMRYFCKMITVPGGVVLDPFMGSGTTGIAGLKEGFKFIGIENDDQYFEIAQSRLKGIKYE